MICFTADQHFGHANIIRLCSRPFPDVRVMDEALIENWNRRVTNRDTIYIIGDLFFRNEVPAEKYLKRLKGKKHLLLGNHDSTWIHKVDLAEYFLSVERLAEIEVGQRELVLCHYPMMSWNGMSRGSFMIHGHIHESTRAQYWPLLQNNPRILNAGVDINSFGPVTFEEMLENNMRHKEKAANAVSQAQSPDGEANAVSQAQSPDGEANTPEEL